MISKKEYDIKFFKWVQQEVAKFNMIAGKTPEELTGVGQLALCEEEVDELLEAYGNGDMAATLKEAIDCIVVSSPLKGRLGIYLMDGVWREVNYITETVHNERWEELLSCSVCMLLQLPTDHYRATKEVLQSNLSKFSIYQTMLEVDYDKHCHTLMEDGRYSDVTWQVAVYEGIHFVVWKDNNGKCMKGLDYKEASLERYLWK